MQEEISGVPTSSRLFIANMRDGAEAGFKYLAFAEADRQLEAEIRGDAEGVLEARLDAPDGPVAARISVTAAAGWHRACAALAGPVLGTHALHFVFRGTGALDFYVFRTVHDTAGC